ncbi:MAG: sulfite exporter TauE/SafE family protein [Burkholderiaceae bacterium]|nr:sulfite exporter TauE/SafE family protein [Burkholderiaceae bacterium]
MNLSLMSAFLLGLFGGVHCASMCGGIVALLGARHRMMPLRLQPGGAAVAALRSGTLLQFAYNLGRVGSYSAAGALAGAVGSAAWMAERVLPVQQASFVAANLVLIVLGLALTGGFRRLRVLERFGAGAWKRVAPIASRLLGATSVPGAFAAGVAWGWVPCGMVYGVLAAALVSGSAAQGALLLLAFGIGTLPNLLALGLAAQRISRWFALPSARLAAGSLIVAFGVAGLMRIDPIAHLQQAVDVCVQWFR